MPGRPYRSEVVGRAHKMSCCACGKLEAPAWGSWPLDASRRGTPRRVVMRCAADPRCSGLKFDVE